MVEDGEFLVYSDGDQELARLVKGACFGELALLNQALRPAFFYQLFMS